MTEKQNFDQVCVTCGWAYGRHYAQPGTDWTSKLLVGATPAGFCPGADGVGNGRNPERTFAGKTEKICKMHGKKDLFICSNFPEDMIEVPVLATEDDLDTHPPDAPIPFKLKAPAPDATAGYYQITLDTHPPDAVLPTDSEARKEIPLFSGVLNYFPLACAAVARLSKKGNDKHNPGQPLHWAREKSTDHLDCIARHLVDVHTKNADGEYEDATAMAWRALAVLQELEEKRLGKGPSRGSK
jgi:hypothetical protein